MQPANRQCGDATILHQISKMLQTKAKKRSEIFWRHSFGHKILKQCTKWQQQKTTLHNIFDAADAATTHFYPYFHPLLGLTRGQREKKTAYIFITVGFAAECNKYEALMLFFSFIMWVCVSALLFWHFAINFNWVNISKCLSGGVGVSIRWKWWIMRPGSL